MVWRFVWGSSDGRHTVSDPRRKHSPIRPPRLRPFHPASRGQGLTAVQHELTEEHHDRAPDDGVDEEAHDGETHAIQRGRGACGDQTAEARGRVGGGNMGGRNADERQEGRWGNSQLFRWRAPIHGSRGLVGRGLRRRQRRDTLLEHAPSCPPDARVFARLQQSLSPPQALPPPPPRLGMI